MPTGSHLTAGTEEHLSLCSIWHCGTLAGSQTFLSTVTQFSACLRPLLLLRPSSGSSGLLWNIPVARNVSFRSSSEVSAPTVTPEDRPTENDPPLLEDPRLLLFEESNPGSILLLAFGLLELGWPPKVVTDITLGAVAIAFILEGTVFAPGV